MNRSIMISFLFSFSIFTMYSMENPKPAEETQGNSLQRKLSGVIHRLNPKSLNRTKSEGHLQQKIDPRKELETDYVAQATQAIQARDQAQYDPDYVAQAKYAIQERDQTQFDEILKKMKELEIDQEVRAQLTQQWKAAASPAQSNDGSYLYRAALEAVEQKDSVKFRWSKDKVRNPQTEARLQNLWDAEKKYIPEAEAAINFKEEEAFNEALKHITDKRTKNRLQRRWDLAHNSNATIITSPRFAKSKGSLTLHRRNPSEV